MAKKNGRRNGRRNGRKAEPAKQGQKTKLTKTLQKKLCELVGQTVPIKFAAGSQGISEATVHNWIAWGKEGRQPYLEFFESITRARNEAVARLVKVINTAAVTDWRAAVAILERQYPREFAKRQALEVTGKDGGAIPIHSMQRDFVASTFNTPKARRAARDFYNAATKFDEMNGKTQTVN